MNWASILPLFLGAIAILQGGINRKIAQSWGLGATVFLNNLCFLAGGLCLFLVSKLAPETLPSIFRDKGSFTNLSWWYFLPGIFGFLLATGIPLSIAKIGALNLFVWLIAAQLATSIVWDAVFEGTPVTWIRIAGALLGCLSAFMVSWKK